jgi:hypothetical protein
MWFVCHIKWFAGVTNIKLLILYGGSNGCLFVMGIIQIQNAGIVVLNVMVSSVTTWHEGLICIIGTG